MLAPWWLESQLLLLLVLVLLLLLLDELLVEVLAVQHLQLGRCILPPPRSL